MATKKQILESEELLQQKRRAYHLSDEGFEEYKEQDDKELLGAMGRVVYE